MQAGLRIFGATTTVLCLGAFAADTERGEIDWEFGIQTGYHLGQNGEGWPRLRDPLANNNRGGFYLRHVRLQGTIPFDSTFSAVAQGELSAPELKEAYLRKEWGRYLFKGGKFRGAGLKSANIDEFALVTVRPPRYARFWGIYKRRLDFRDYGVEAERSFLGGSLLNRFYFHNASGQNVVIDEPSLRIGPPTQALGLDYGFDWRFSPRTTLGGHAGALANKEYAEFQGPHAGWEAQYWFKSNPLVDFSLYHQLQLPRVRLFTEAMLMINRDILVPPAMTPLRSWGGSTLLQLEHSPWLESFFRYEFFDETDGLNPDDALHVFSAGAGYHPAPAKFQGLKLTAQYVRGMEEGMENLVGNDVLYLQFQMVY